MEREHEKSRPMFGLVTHLRRTVADLMKEEAQLAKAEMSEKAGIFGRNAVAIAAGAAIAYAGAVVLLIGLGFLLAQAFASLDWGPALANFAGFAIIALIVFAIGAILVFKGVQTFSNGSLKPDRTIQALGLKSGNSSGKPAPSKPSTEELETRLDLARQEIGETFGEIRDRVSHANNAVKRQIRHHPARSILLGLACGAALGHRMRRRKSSRRSPPGT